MRFHSPFQVTDVFTVFVSHKPRRIFSICLLAAAFIAGGASVARADAQAQDILKKMTAVYDVRSFQGTVTRIETGFTDENKPFHVSSIEEVTFKQPNLFYIKNSGPGVGGTQISLFDGRETINYVSTRNQYTKMPPMAAGKSNVSVLSLLGVSLDVQSGKLLSSTTLAGKSAYVVQAFPPVVRLPGNVAAIDKNQMEQLRKLLVPYELVIDKKDYRLLRITQTTPAIKMIKTLDITQQTLNPNVADSMFVFTPPAGAKQVTRTAQEARAMIAVGVNGKPGSMGARVSSGSGSPVPPPHASPGGNRTAHKP